MVCGVHGVVGVGAQVSLKLKLEPGVDVVDDVVGAADFEVEVEIGVAVGGNDV